MGHDVALVISDLGSGGAQRVVAQLVSGWHHAGRRVAVITHSQASDDFFQLPMGVTRLSLGGRQDSASIIRAAIANIGRMLRLRRAIRDTGSPVIAAFMTQMAVLTVIACVGLGHRVIVCERNDPSRQSFGPIWNRLRRIVYPLASKVTANSQGALTALREFVPERRLAYVPNPISKAACAAPTERSPTIITVGRLHRQKAHDILLAAFAKFQRTHSDWRLVIIGDGRERPNLTTLAEQLGVVTSVDWLGRQQDPCRSLRTARIFALPSRYEGMPNALMEAMACGVACIVSDASSGPLELIEDCVTGLVVPAESPCALATAFRRLADDSVFRERLGNAAKHRIARHALPVALQQWDQVLELAPRGQCASLS